MNQHLFLCARTSASITDEHTHSKRNCSKCRIVSAFLLYTLAALRRNNCDLSVPSVIVFFQVVPDSRMKLDPGPGNLCNATVQNASNGTFPN